MALERKDRLPADEIGEKALPRPPLPYDGYGGGRHLFQVHEKFVRLVRPLERAGAAVVLVVGAGWRLAGLLGGKPAHLLD